MGDWPHGYRLLQVLTRRSPHKFSVLGCVLQSHGLRVPALVGRRLSVDLVDGSASGPMVRGYSDQSLLPYDGKVAAERRGVVNERISADPAFGDLYLAPPPDGDQQAQVDRLVSSPSA